MKNNTLFWLLIIFTILNIVDSITTLFILDGESNPLYHLFGQSLYVVLIIKFLIVLMFWYWYKINKYDTHFAYFMMLAILVYGCVALLVAQVVNIYGIMNPTLLEESKDIPTDVKVESYFKYMSIIYMFPLIFSLVVFWLYQRSYHKVYIDKDFYKQQGWWKFW